MPPVGKDQVAYFLEEYARAMGAAGMADYQKPNVPEFAGELDHSILQMHSTHYKNPDQLRDGAVLVELVAISRTSRGNQRRWGAAGSCHVQGSAHRDSQLAANVAST